VCCDDIPFPHHGLESGATLHGFAAYSGTLS
jgi:hypothetical protein